MIRINRENWPIHILIALSCAGWLFYESSRTAALEILDGQWLPAYWLLAPFFHGALWHFLLNAMALEFSGRSAAAHFGAAALFGAVRRLRFRGEFGEQSIRRRPGDWSQRGGAGNSGVHDLSLRARAGQVSGNSRPAAAAAVSAVESCGGAGVAGRGGGSFQLGIFRALGALGRAGQRNGDGLAVFSPPAGHSAAVSGPPRAAIRNQALAPKTCWRTMRI